MSYIHYKQWADHWESLKHQAIAASLSDEDEDDDEFDEFYDTNDEDEFDEFYDTADDDTADDVNAVVVICLAVIVCLLSFIIAMIIA